MRIAIALLLVGLGTVLFHLLSPWWWTPIASNWGFLDKNILITFWITGAVFVAVMAFLSYCVYRYRYREDRRAEYEPESGKLELVLTLGTAVGVVALLTPGLFAWADFVTVPDDAVEVEVLGYQWTWSFRYPGEDGELGTTDIALISADNPFGMNADDPNGQDDILIASNELHMLVDQPIKVLLRSKDVLHNFYVPQFRAKMDMVPGMITSFWLSPIRTGKFEILCAELCGTGHYLMRGHVVVEEEEDFRAWLAEQPTFADAGTAGDLAQTGDPAAHGKQLAESNGCLGCHTLDGNVTVGPSWKGLYGKTETLTDGTTAEVDDAFLKESITDPNAKVPEGFNPGMPPYQFSDAELDALVAFIKSIE